MVGEGELHDGSRDAVLSGAGALRTEVVVSSSRQKCRENGTVNVSGTREIEQ